MAEPLLPSFPAAIGPTTGDAATADVAAQAAWMNQLRATASQEDGGAVHGGALGGRARKGGPTPGSPSATALKLKGAVTSQVGVSVLVVLAVFVLTMVLLAAIQPPFVMQAPASKMETETLSGKRVAVGGFISACITALCMGIAAIVIHSKRKQGMK